MQKCLSHRACFICDEPTFKLQMQNFIPLIKKCYQLYFDCKVDQYKSWAHIFYVTRSKLLTDQHLRHDQLLRHDPSFHISNEPMRHNDLVHNFC